MLPSTYTLMTLLNNTSEEGKAYLRDHPKPSGSILIPRILLGAPTPDCASSLISVFAKFLERYRETDAYIIITILFEIIKTAHGTEHQSAILGALRESDELWDSWFLLLRVSARNYGIDSAPQYVGGPSVFKPVFGIPYNIISTTSLTQNEREAFILQLVRAGLFDTLDETMQLLVSLPGLTEQIYGIVGSIAKAMTSNPSQNLINTLHTQFPRQRTFHALFSRWYSRDCQIRDTTTPVRFEWDLHAFQAMHFLDERFHDPAVCGRRQCQAATTARCSRCKRVGYCGPGHQKEDWKEHKLVCGFEKRGEGYSVTDITPPFLYDR